MKWLSWLVVVLLLPGPAGAQSVKLADIVGTWTRPGPEVYDKEQNKSIVMEYDTLVLQPDSTFHWGYRKNKGPKPVYMRWNYLRGDTLSLKASGSCHTSGVLTKDKNAESPTTCEQLCWSPKNPNGYQLSDCFKGEYQIKLQDKQLTLAPLPGTSNQFGGTYTRVDPPKPTTP